MIEIIPSILAKTSEELVTMIKKIEPFVSLVHLDIADGIFVDSKTVGLEEVKKISTPLRFSVHLMVNEPQYILNEWLELSNLDNIIFHINNDDLDLVHNDGVNKNKEIIDTVHKAGKKIGVAINPEVPIGVLESLVTSVDQVQFMTVHPGNYGGDFVEGVIEKIKDFHRLYPDVRISVDGSIHKEIARTVIDAGASTIVLGSHIFSEGRDIGEAINELRNL
jgi:ribulose-phosphate 3-epimerase